MNPFHRLSLILSLGLCLVGASASPADAAPAPRWSISSLALPTDFSTSQNSVENCAPLNFTYPLSSMACNAYSVAATNSGAAATVAKEVTIEDTLPADLDVRSVSLFWIGPRRASAGSEEENLNATGATCTVSLPRVKCSLKASVFKNAGHGLDPDDQLRMMIVVGVDEPATPGPVVNEAAVEGGGAPRQETSSTNSVEEGARFGPALFRIPALASDGLAASQAGSHPSELPTLIGLNSEIREEAQGKVLATSVEDLRDVLVDLPPGLVGSALSTPIRCTFAQLS